MGGKKAGKASGRVSRGRRPIGTKRNGGPADIAAASDRHGSLLRRSWVANTGLGADRDRTQPTLDREIERAELAWP